MRADGVLELALVDVEVPEPAHDEVVLRVEAAPIHPSSLGLLLGAADPQTARRTEDGADGRLLLDVPAEVRAAVAGRVGMSLPAGNEGAGVVVAAGASVEAKALLGRTVAVAGGAMYSQFHTAKVAACLVLPDNVTPAQGAGSYVNPMTVLGMVGTMRLDHATALVHTAAASNLGQMLVRHCLAEDVPLVNVVRRPEQVELLRGTGAAHVCDSSSPDFRTALVEALVATEATVAFDAVGGGLTATLLGAMEAVLSRSTTGVPGYGSSVVKRSYVYGALDRSPIVLPRNVGMAWSVSGWLLGAYLDRVGPEETRRMRERVAAEITTTFATSYAAELSLDEVLTPEAIAAYSRLATDEKYLVNPNK